MSHPLSKDTRVLAIAPSTRGFGFAVLEGQDSLVDWGVKSARQDKNVRCLTKVNELIECYRPKVVVLEDCSVSRSRRGRRTQELIAAIITMASESKLRIRAFSRRHIRQAFAAEGAVTRQEIATAITRRFPELAPRLPRERRQ